MYKTIESYFMSEEGITELLESYSDDFQKIDKISEDLKSGTVNSYEDIDNLLGVLAGLANRCELVAEIADTYKLGEQGRLTFGKINSAGDKKVTMTKVDAEVSHEVQSLRRVRNIFRAYTKNADRALGTCQSRLKKKEKSQAQQG